MPDFSQDLRPENPAFTDCTVKAFAFESGGVEYYGYTKEGWDMNYGKWQEIVATNELHDKWAMTQADKEAHLSLVKHLCHSPNFTPEERLDEIYRLTVLIEERSHYRHPETMYEEAAIYFFDRSENPAHYDSTYGKEKIRRWMADADLLKKKGFWLVPTSSFLPLPVQSMQFTEEEWSQILTALRENLVEGTLTAALWSVKALTVGESSGIDDSLKSVLRSRAVTLSDYDRLLH